MLTPSAQDKGESIPQLRLARLDLDLDGFDRTSVSTHLRNVVLIKPHTGPGGATGNLRDGMAYLERRGSRVLSFTSRRDPSRCLASATVRR